MSVKYVFYLKNKSVKGMMQLIFVIKILSTHWILRCMKVFFIVDCININKHFLVQKFKIES